MPIAPPPCPQLARGIYRAPYRTPENEAVLLAVDVGHRLVLTRELGPEDDAEEVTAEMWKELDRVDPEHSRCGTS